MDNVIRGKCKEPMTDEEERLILQDLKEQQIDILNLNGNTMKMNWKLRTIIIIIMVIGFPCFLSVAIIDAIFGRNNVWDVLKMMSRGEY